MDKFKQLESFVSVATRGSLTAAAAAEGVAPPSWGAGWTRWRNAWA
jgi:DNA-binding transcriptional LysR family regulator